VGVVNWKFVSNTRNCLLISGTGKVGVAEAELKSELKSKEAELEGLRQAVSMEEKERADIITAEKKIRLQVRGGREGQNTHTNKQGHKQCHTCTQGITHIHTKVCVCVLV